MHKWYSRWGIQKQMLWSRLVRRHAKHHSQMLAYLDALEDLIQELAHCRAASATLRENESLLNQFSEFMRIQNPQHETEEERLLRPSIEKELNGVGDSMLTRCLTRICQDHQVGRRLFEDFDHQKSHLTQAQSLEAETVDAFTAVTLDLVWHFRRHIWVENTIILPVLKQDLPGSPAEAWDLD